MYILCFRMRELLDVPTKLPAKSFLFDLPLGSILCNRLDPLKVLLIFIIFNHLPITPAHLLFACDARLIHLFLLDCIEVLAFCLQIVTQLLK